MAPPDRRNLMIDAIQNKIVRARCDLERYREEYNQCQIILAKEQEQRAQLDADNQCLQRRNSQLESELELVRATLQEANAALGESTRLRKALDQREVLLTEKIELLKWETNKAKNHALEADRLAQESIKRSSDLRDRLTLCEKKLEKSLESNAMLHADLRACGKRRCARCVEHAQGDVRTTHQTSIVERKIDELYDNLNDSERQAQLAKANVKQLQRASERLEQRWRDRFAELGASAAPPISPPNPCRHSKG